jgi:methyltransferase
VTGVVAFSVVFISMLFEARLSFRNEKALRARGGIEASGDVYRSMRIAYPLAFIVMIAEGVVRRSSAGPMFLAGLLVFAAGKAVKWWAMRSLGPLWSFRVIIVPGTRLVSSGPYAFMRHPNYLGLAGELVGVALMTGAIITGPIATAGFLLLVLKRIRVENRALDAILRRH